MIGNIQMVDLLGQYGRIQNEIDTAVLKTIRSGSYINGPEVKSFQSHLEQYLNVHRVIPCANGTDALQVALMALDLQRGDEVILPAFTYAATAEVIALLGLVPKWVEVDPKTFNIAPAAFEAAVSHNTKVVVPVHLFGQCAEMEQVLAIAEKNDLFVIEDAAQAIGASYTFSNTQTCKAGTMGDIGCTSFFPSKNLGCYGDGGAMYTNDPDLAHTIYMIANHGQAKKYYHELVGVNSRLDSLQAAILNVKLRYLDTYSGARARAADCYDELLKDVSQIDLPFRQPSSTHVFNQYTVIVKEGSRDELKSHLESNGVPTMIYYPLPMHLQKAYRSTSYPEGSFPVSEALSKQVLSLPIHTEISLSDQEKVAASVKAFFNK